jgi:hypothetical protein
VDGPLTRIEISDDLNCAVSHIDDTEHPEFYGDTACATLVAVGGTLYGPAAIPAGGSASPRTPFTPISQSSVTGSGSGADPYQIVTEVALGSSGLRLVQTDSYAVGEESYRTDLEGNDRSANPTLSGDGATVAFHSFATNLVPNDTNGVADVFVRGPDQ